MFSTDYLVICGRVSARLMDSASATLESPLDSNNHIIAQVLCPVQRSFMQRFQLSACPPIRVLNAHACLSTAI